MAQTYKTLLVETDDSGISVLTINRPDKLNALNAEVMADLEGVIMKLRNSSQVRGIIITGAGDKAFVAGADIRELSELNNFTGTVLSERGQEVFSLLEHSTKPVIAWVNGYALGGGCELALACHIRIASERAVLGLPEVSLGLIPGYGGTQRLTQLVGKGRAFELILSGSPIKAEQALAIGLVNRVVLHETGLEEARNLMKTILGKGPVALSKAIKAVNAACEQSGQGFKVEAESFGALCGTRDFKEGTAAFLEKRQPQFNGN